MAAIGACFAVGGSTMESNKESRHYRQGAVHCERVSSRPDDGAIRWCHQDETNPYPFDAFAFTSR